MRFPLSLLAALALPLATLCPAPPAAGYPVGFALSLADLEQEADFIAKVVPRASEMPAESPYRDLPGYYVVATQLDVVEVYKSPASGAVGPAPTFVHYTSDYDVLTLPAFPGTTYLLFYPTPGGRGPYMPQYYDLQPGRPYILFAKATDRPGILHQLWENHKSKDDQGLVRAADEARHGEASIHDVIWTELTRLLASGNHEEVIYAIRQLDQMSGGGYERLADYQRAAVLTVLEPFIREDDAEIARRAIVALGSRNPYLEPGFAAGWLATVGDGNLPGYGTWEPAENTGGKQHWQSLVAVADSERPAEIRALAIVALGRAQLSELADHVARWLDDPEPQVRQAAAILLADFPDLATAATLERLASDPEPAARIGATRAIGFGQFAEHAPLLGKLIDDADPQVAAAAAISLLSFPTGDVRPILEAHVDHAEYWPLVVNALARDNPEPYRDKLAEIVRTDAQPTHWWGGRIPWGVSWELLFDYVRSRPGGLAGGRRDRLLDALESPQYYSSSEPRDLYALYLQRRMKERAAAFRAACRERLSYDIDHYFDMVDKNPASYTRDR